MMQNQRLYSNPASHSGIFTCRRRKLNHVLIPLLCVTLLTACNSPRKNDHSQDTAIGTESGTNTEAESGYTFTDDLGRTVTVTSCRRTAALLGSYADVWILAGGDVCATADDAWEDFDLELAADTVNLGGTKDLSLEGLLSSDPDFVIASTNTTQHLEWQSALENAGITVAYFDVTDFDDYLRMLKVCTDLTGNSESYKVNGTDLALQIQEIIDRSQGKPAQSVLVLRASASFIRAKNSSGTVLGTMLKDLGCINIADDDDSLLENLSIESIALANPDKIFLIPSGDDLEGTKENVEKMFLENPLWNELEAVKNDKVYYMDKRLYGFKPNALWAESYRQLEELLYAL